MTILFRIKHREKVALFIQFGIIYNIHFSHMPCSVAIDYYALYFYVFTIIVLSLPTVTCRPSCNPSHGACVEGICRCNEGWSGDACDVRLCSHHCGQHGICIEGLCVCKIGWNGAFCTLGTCPTLQITISKLSSLTDINH